VVLSAVLNIDYNELFRSTEIRPIVFENIHAVNLSFRIKMWVFIFSYNRDFVITVVITEFGSISIHSSSSVSTKSITNWYYLDMAKVVWFWLRAIFGL